MLLEGRFGAIRPVSPTGPPVRSSAWHAVQAAGRRAGPLLADDGVLVAVAEAVEPGALLAERRDVAAQVRALAIEREHFVARVCDPIAAAKDKRLRRRHVDEEDARLREAEGLALDPGCLRAGDIGGGAERELAAQ